MNKIKKILHFFAPKLKYDFRKLYTASPACKIEYIQQKEAHKLPQNYGKTGSLYIHWPYCQKRCSYCNFNKYIQTNVNHNRMKQCLVHELKTLILISGIEKINSIFFGGGTPSLAEPNTMHDIIDCAAKMCDLARDAEITIECNPTSTECDKLIDFRAAGVNRVSLGIQTLNEAHLKFLGREHTVEQSKNCLKTAKKLFPQRTSVDLMFGRPAQVVSEWSKELHNILQLCDSHLSLYQLTLERGTELYKQVAHGIVCLPSNEEMSHMYESAVKILDEIGFLQYEVSNFALRGSESKHNQSYWKGYPYIGIGPGAHGRFVVDGCREARIQTLEPDPWMEEVEKYGHGTRKRVQQTGKKILEEVLMLGLRTRSGVSHNRWNSFCPKTLYDVFQCAEMVNEFIKEDLLVIDNIGLRATRRGLSVIDSIVPELFISLDNAFEHV